MEEKSISEFLSNEYKEFALYVIENRAIPSVIDGLKPSHRKVIHIASKIWKTGNEKVLKVFQLTGKVASDAFYHHGDASLSNSIINIAQSFKNNASLLEEDGQFGSLRSPQPGAPRYIGTKLSPYFRMIYKDHSLLTFKEEEGESIEPKYFLPIIPTVLVNASSGIAVGFATNILNRNMDDIITSCIGYLKNGKIKKVEPSLNAFTGNYRQDDQNHKKWFISGKFEIVNTTTVHISELPPSMTYEKYELILETLIDDKKIVSYDDKCADDINYIIKFKRNELKSFSDYEILKLLKLEESQTENFTTLDEDGKLKIFENSSDIIKYFMDFRLSYYDKRKKFMIDKINREIKMLTNRSQFIKLILQKKIILNNKPKADIIDQIEKHKLEKQDASYDYLLRMPLYSLTKELVDKIAKDIILEKAELARLKKLKPKEMYVDDLNQLKKDVKSYEKQK